VWLGGVDFHRGARELLGVPLLENGDDARRHRVLGLLELEPTRALAQTEFAIDPVHVVARHLVREGLLRNSERGISRSCRILPDFETCSKKVLRTSWLARISIVPTVSHKSARSICDLN
jgi:hypothetical protein